MRALVIGYGSIGARHARLLTELGCDTAVVSNRAVDFPVVFPDLAVGVRAHRPDYVVIASPTDQHHEMIGRLADIGFAGGTMVEKPLFATPAAIPPNAFRNSFVGYNLRFHPVIQRVRELLAGETVLSVSAYVGQYLPDWRPNADYRLSYSASAKRGGGALRDLSHEIDYLGWLFGSWVRVAALGGHFSPLQIDSDDLYALLLQYERCPVLTLQVSYLDRIPRRRMLINTVEHTIEADLIAGTVRMDRDEETFACDRDHTYRQMHMAALMDNTDALCSMHEGLMTMQLIDAAERATQQKEWIFR